MQDQNYNQEKRSQQKLKADQEKLDYIRNKEIIEKKMEEKRRAKELERIEYNNSCDRYSRKEKLKDESYKNVLNHWKTFYFIFFYFFLHISIILIWKKNRKNYKKCMNRLLYHQKNRRKCI